MNCIHLFSHKNTFIRLYEIAPSFPRPEKRHRASRSAGGSGDRSFALLLVSLSPQQPFTRGTSAAGGPTSLAAASPHPDFSTSLETLSTLHTVPHIAALAQGYFFISWQRTCKSMGCFYGLGFFFPPQGASISIPRQSRASSTRSSICYFFTYQSRN